MWTLKGLEKVSLDTALHFYQDLAKRNDHEMDKDFAKSITMSVIETQLVDPALLYDGLGICY